MMNDMALQSFLEIHDFHMSLLNQVVVIPESKLWKQERPFHLYQEDR